MILSVYGRSSGYGTCSGYILVQWWLWYSGSYGTVVVMVQWWLWYRYR